MDDLVSEKVLDIVIIQDADGRIIWNAGQMNSPVILRQYSDRTREFVDQKTGKVIRPRYDPSKEDIPACVHCGNRPW
jgi:hypothetical protein